MKAWLARNFGIDLRALGVFRIGLALCVIGDILIRFTDVRAFYSDEGILPRAQEALYFQHPYAFSLYMGAGAWQFALVLLLITLLAAFAMLVGFRSRLSTFITWVLILSVQTRNPGILGGPDTLERMLLFWAMFLPIGARYSVDAAMASAQQNLEDDEPHVFSWASAALLLQVVFLYWFAVILKSGSEWRHEGTAVWYAMSLEQLQTPLTRLLLHIPGFLRFLNFFVLAEEALAPIMLLLPVPLVRAIGVLFLAAMQIGFFSTLRVGLFPFLSSVALIPFLPSFFWERGERRRDRSGITIYFDGGCDFCRKSVLILREFLLPRDTPLVPAQDSPETHEELRRQNSWIVVDAQGRHYRTDAFAVMFAHSRLPWLAPVLRLKIVQRIGDAMYRRIERARPIFSRWMAPVRYKQVPMKSGKAAQTFVALALLLVTWENLWSISDRMAMPQSVQWPIAVLRIDQRWDMFSPYPPRHDGWYVIPGELSSGKKIDLFRDGEEVSFARRQPAEVAGQFKNERWRKFLMDTSRGDNQRYLVGWSEFICRSWNRGKKQSDPDWLRSFEIIFVGHDTAPPGGTPMPYEPNTIVGYRCGAM